MTPTLTQLAKGTAEFVRYEDGQLWYQITWQTVEDCTCGQEGCSMQVPHTFDFPIPTDAPELATDVRVALSDLVYTDGEDVVTARSNIYSALDAQQKRGAGVGQFLRTDKAITFLRWIRPHLELLKAAHVG